MSVRVGSYWPGSVYKVPMAEPCPRGNPGSSSPMGVFLASPLGNIEVGLSTPQPRPGFFFSIFISKAWIASISRSWQNQDTCKIPYNTLDSQKVPKSTVKLTLPLQEMYDTNNTKLNGEKVPLVSKVQLSLHNQGRARKGTAYTRALHTVGRQESDFQES